MAVIVLKIPRLKEIRRRYADYPNISARHLANAINQIISAVEKGAKPITPFKSGDLFGSYDIGRELATPAKLKGRVKPDVPYAGFVHDLYPKGQSYKNPTKAGTLPRFLEIGVDRAKADIERIVRDNLDNITRDLGD